MGTGGGETGWTSTPQPILFQSLLSVLTSLLKSDVAAGPDGLGEAYSRSHRFGFISSWLAAF